MKNRFNPILAKNEIARNVKDYLHHEGGFLAVDSIISCLEDIEKYIGESNQPSVEEIMTSERNDI